MEIFADHIVLEADQIVATGNVVVVGDGFRVTAAEAHRIGDRIVVFKGVYAGPEGEITFAEGSFAAEGLTMRQHCLACRRRLRY